MLPKLYRVSTLGSDMVKENVERLLKPSEKQDRKEKPKSKKEGSVSNRGNRRNFPSKLTPLRRKGFLEMMNMWSLLNPRRPQSKRRPINRAHNFKVQHFQEERGAPREKKSGLS